MKKYLNRIKKLEIQTGTDNVEEWLAMVDTDGTAELTTITAPKPQDTKKTLTANEYSRFRAEKDGRIIEIRWVD